MKINPMFIQALIGMGADLSAYGADTSKGMQFAGLNKSTAQNISSSALLKLMQQALSPDDLNIKASNKGLTINMPNPPEEPEQLSGPVDEKTMAAAPTTISTPVIPGAVPGAVPNPFAPSPLNLKNLDPSMLAGLTSQDIMSVIGARQAQDQLKQQSYRDMVASLYKESAEGRAVEAAPVELDYKKQLTKQAEAATIENTPSVPVKIGDETRLLTPKDAIAWKRMEKETATNEIKNFEYAQKYGYTGSPVDFRNIEIPEKIKLYNEAVKSGYPPNQFDRWYREIVKLGTPSTGEKVEQKRSLSDVDRENEVRHADFSSKITETLKKDERAWRDSTRVDDITKRTGKPPEEVRTALQRDKVFREMDHRIKSVYPKATFVRGKGWVTEDGLIIQRDPYAK